MALIPWPVKSFTVAIYYLSCELYRTYEPDHQTTNTKYGIICRRTIYFSYSLLGSQEEQQTLMLDLSWPVRFLQAIAYCLVLYDLGLCPWWCLGFSFAVIMAPVCKQKRQETLCDFCSREKNYCCYEAKETEEVRNCFQRKTNFVSNQPQFTSSA